MTDTEQPPVIDEQNPAVDEQEQEPIELDVVRPPAPVQIFPKQMKNGYRTCESSGAFFPTTPSNAAQLVKMRAAPSQLKAQQDEHANDLQTLQSEMSVLKDAVKQLQHEVLTLIQKQGGLS